MYEDYLLSLILVGGDNLVCHRNTSNQISHPRRIYGQLQNSTCYLDSSCSTHEAPHLCSHPCSPHSWRYAETPRRKTNWKYHSSEWRHPYEFKSWMGNMTWKYLRAEDQRFSSSLRVWLNRLQGGRGYYSPFWWLHSIVWISLATSTVEPFWAYCNFGCVWWIWWRVERVQFGVMPYLAVRFHSRNAGTYPYWILGSF